MVGFRGFSRPVITLAPVRAISFSSREASANSKIRNRGKHHLLSGRIAKSSSSSPYGSCTGRFSSKLSARLCCWFCKPFSAFSQLSKSLLRSTTLLVSGMSRAILDAVEVFERSRKEQSLETLLPPLPREQGS